MSRFISKRCFTDVGSALAVLMMSRFIRFIVHQRIRDESRRLGVFSAAYYLRDEVELPRYDRERLERLLAWFVAELKVPPKDVIPERAIFWYRDVGPFSQVMWELSQLIEDHGFTTEVITARFIGRIVYRDEHQCAALPPTRRHR